MKFYLKLDEIDIIAKELTNKDIILLYGDLASGKTTLTKKIVELKNGYKFVTSPTFNIMQQYSEIYHYDLYNTDYENIIKNGLIQNFFEDGLHIVEWPNEELEEFLKKNFLNYTKVFIKPFNNYREYEVINA